MANIKTLKGKFFQVVKFQFNNNSPSRDNERRTAIKRKLNEKTKIIPRIL